MADATVVIDGDKRGLDRTLGSMDSSMQSWAKNTRRLIAGALAFVAAKSAITAGKNLIGLANEQADAEAKLASVLRSTGNAAGFSADELKRQASELQKITTVGDESIISMQAVLATFTQVKGDQFEGATKAALNMSAVLGTDLKGSAIQLGKALNDPIKGMSALSRSGVSFTEEQKKLVASLVETGNVVAAQELILAELSVEFGGAAEAMAKTGSGPMKQFMNSLGDIGETLGEVLNTFLAPFAKWFVDASPVVQNFADILLAGTESGASSVQAFAETSMGWLSNFFDVMLQTFTGAQTLFGNWGKSGTTAFDTILLAYEIWKNRLVHFFTGVLPELLSWFSENWTKVFLDAANYTATIYSNMFKNIVEFFTAIASYLKGDGFDFKWTALTEGFEASLDELPKIADRKISDLENELADKIARNAMSISEKFNKNLEANRKALGLGPTEDVNDFNAKRAKSEISAAIPEAAEQAKKAAGRGGRGADSTNESQAPRFEALDALFKRISSSGDDPAEKTAKNTETMADLLGKMNKNLIAANQGRAPVFQ